MVRRVRDCGMAWAFAGRGTAENGSCVIGGAVDDSAIEWESVGTARGNSVVMRGQ